MIECCSPKRMLSAILSLGVLTLIVLVYESNWAYESSNNNHFGNYSVQKNASAFNVCKPDEELIIVNSCHPCSDFEIASKSNQACLPTNFKELIKCQKSGNKFYQSCDIVEWLEEKKFWQFQLFVFIVAFISAPCVFLRQKTLDLRHLKNLQRRLARSV